MQGRDLPGAYCLKTVAFLRGLLRLDPREAGARVRAAQDLAPRRALTGEPLPPVFAQVAAAQDAGAISDRHARIIVTTIDKLPDAIQAEHGEQIERELVDYAGRFDPHQLNRLADRVRYCYDPDGKYSDADHRDKTRGITVQHRQDGSCSGSFEGTAEFGEFLQLTFDALGKPAPEVDGFKDPRTAATTRCSKP